MHQQQHSHMCKSNMTELDRLNVIDMHRSYSRATGFDEQVERRARIYEYCSERMFLPEHALGFTF